MSESTLGMLRSILSAIKREKVKALAMSPVLATVVVGAFALPAEAHHCFGGPCRN